MGIDRTQLRLNAFNRKRVRFGEDVCTIIDPGSDGDGYNSSAEPDTTLDSDVPCFYKLRGSPLQQTLADGSSVTLTHDLMMESSVIAKGMKPNYRIEVAPRGERDALMFRHPVLLDGSWAPLVHVVAMLTV